ncbi:acyl-CoA reductase [soil metagenome]
MKIIQRIKAFDKLGSHIDTILKTDNDVYKSICNQAYLKNNWFTKDNIDSALHAWCRELTASRLHKWIDGYDLEKVTERKVGVINAGNIPLVGFHDMLSVLLSGHLYFGKNASDDNLLLPYITTLLMEVEPAFKSRIHFVDRLTEFDAVIATGSNNSARYFESYFGKVPHIIRKNRNGVGVLTGKESKEDLEKMGRDIFQYFGLGCRNVSKIYVPEGTIFDPFFEAMFSFNGIMQHSKYMNNFDYNNAMLLMKLIPFLQNGFLIIHEDERIPSPISVVHYEKYKDQKDLINKLDTAENQIQCLVVKEKLELKSDLKNRQFNFGEGQSPALNDYADGVDSLQFLSSI